MYSDTGLGELQTIMLNDQCSVTDMETRFSQFESSLNQVKENNQKLEESKRNMDKTEGDLPTKVNRLENEMKLS